MGTAAAASVVCSYPSAIKDEKKGKDYVRYAHNPNHNPNYNPVVRDHPRSKKPKQCYSCMHRIEKASFDTANIFLQPSNFGEVVSSIYIEFSHQTILDMLYCRVKHGLESHAREAA